jgi:hypothetical protein
MKEEVELTVTEARQLIDVLMSEDFEDVSTAIDRAQGDVHMGNSETATVTIIIRKD